MNKLKAIALHYIEGAFDSAFNAGVLAVKAAAAVGVAKVAGVAVQLPDPKVIVIIFGGAAFLGAVNYFAANPLPVDPPAKPATAPQA